MASRCQSRLLQCARLVPIQARRSCVALRDRVRRCVERGKAPALMDEREETPAAETPAVERPRSARQTFERALGWTARTGWRGARGLGRAARRRPRMAI